MPINPEVSTVAMLDAVRRLFVMWHLSDDEMTQIFPHVISADDLPFLSASVESLVREQASMYLEINDRLTALYASPETLRFTWFKKSYADFWCMALR